jgi:N utilization substance protein B
MKDSKQFEPRRRARRRALQALYQWQVTGHDESEIVTQFMEEQDFRNVDQEWFRLLLSGVISSHVELDEFLQPFLDRPIKQLDIMELLILRMAAFELKNHSEVPKIVVMNEAIDLARRFGAEQGHSFVNGVLDKAAKQPGGSNDPGTSEESP